MKKGKFSLKSLKIDWKHWGVVIVIALLVTGVVFGIDRFVEANRLEVQGTTNFDDLECDRLEVNKATTFKDDVDLDGNTLIIDEDADTTLSGANDDVITVTIGATNTVGFYIATGNLSVGDGTPDTGLTGEDAYVEGTFEVDGTSRFDGDVDINNHIDQDGSADEVQLAVTGYTTQTSDLVNFDGGLTDIGGGSYTTADGDNDLGIAADLEVVGTSDLRGNVFDSGGDLTLADDTVVTGTMDVGGIFTAESTSDFQDDIADSVGDLTIDDALNVTGDADFDTSVNIDDDLTVGGDFRVTGYTHITVSTAITGDLTLTGDLVVTGVSDFQDDISDSAGDLTLADDVIVTGTLDVDGDVDFDAALDVDGLTNLDDVDIDGYIQGDGFYIADTSGNTTITGTLDVLGATATFGDAITDLARFQSSVRTWDGTDYWQDVVASSMIGTYNNGWQLSYAITDWDAETTATALLGEMRVDAASADISAYGLDGMARMYGIVATGTSTGYGVFGEVLASLTSTWPIAYAVYGQLEAVASPDEITAGSAFRADLAGSGTFGTVSVLSTEADTWDYGIDFDNATSMAADFRFHQGETLDNLVDGVIRATGSVSVTGDLEVGVNAYVTGTLDVVSTVAAQEDLTVDDTFNVDDTEYTAVGNQTITPTFSYYDLNPGSALTLTLAASCEAGDLVWFANRSAQTVIIADTNVRTSDGNLITMNQYDTNGWICVGSTEWYLLYESANS